jgi:glycosyltransferase involved in cell wall biosynthesis
MGNKRILCFASYFLPGFRAGGPIRSLQRIINGLSGDFEFRVVTRDRDFAAREPYPGLAYDRWSETAGITVWYLRPPHWVPTVLRRAIADFHPDLLYFQSFLDPSLVAMPLMLRRLGAIPRSLPVLVAPRGEFAPSALALKRHQKSAWLVLVRVLGLYRDVAWQASNEMEAEHIQAHWGRDARVLIASDLPPLFGATMAPARHRKMTGALRVVFLSRISPMKNLVGTLRIMALSKIPMSLDIYGNKESPEYWGECERIMQGLPARITVTYHGNVPPEEVINVIASYDLFFLPTLGENFGHVILEALLAGCPVLISDRTPWRHLQEKRAGFDLNLDRPEAFVHALENFAAMDDAQFQQWSDGAACLGRQFCQDDSLRQAARAVLDAAMAESGGSP